MSRIDLSRLRKRAGMTQRDLAALLQVRPSFLSAIENGRSRLPEEKLERIKAIFDSENINDYIIEEVSENVVPPHTHTSDSDDSFTHLLTHFHDMAHKHDKPAATYDADAAERMEFLVKRNDRLSERVDNLRDEVDALRHENLRLKELLVRNGIKY